MRSLLSALLLLTCMGCGSRPSSDGLAATPSPNPGPQEMGTPGIVRILEEADIALIWTTHDQRIDITVRDGRVYWGVYRQAEAGKYAKNPHLFDVYNLVEHILAARPEKETEDTLVGGE
ncbi:MAG: hypothetical protein HN341_14590 [Verrucomicrobia bacterium]|jgi:hypothetical protein|nr:hypothetical protein [Verrucomicrobiota bacterium]